MKKLMILFTAFLFLLSGCQKDSPEPQKDSHESLKVEHPYQLLKGEDLISYYYSADDIPDSAGFLRLENTMENISKIQKTEEDCVVVNEKEEIRSVMIKSGDVVTYREISVGDPIEKVTDSFQHALQKGDAYEVAFKKDEEVDLSGQAGDGNNDWIWIIYYVQDSKITMIQIADTNFMQFFK